MCRRLEACVDSSAAAQITVNTVHKAIGLEWPRVLMSSYFNQFVELEKGKPGIDMEEAYIIYVALTRAREKLILSPACVEAIAASAATMAGRIPCAYSKHRMRAIVEAWRSWRVFSVGRPAEQATQPPRLSMQTVWNVGRNLEIPSCRIQGSYVCPVLSARATPGITFGNPLPSSYLWCNYPARGRTSPFASATRNTCTPPIPTSSGTGSRSSPQSITELRRAFISRIRTDICWRSTATAWRKSSRNFRIHTWEQDTSILPKTPPISWKPSSNSRNKTGSETRHLTAPSTTCRI